ncbi:MAG: TonB-dependent receptor [Bacteroidia bacterium]|nr:TonB-dependent receptor [Bacteroidia bacterium]
MPKKINLHVRHASIVLMLAVFSLTVNSQTRVNGKVTGPDSKPVSDATVTVKGTNVATSTTADGAFSLTVPPNHQTLVISHVSFEEMEVRISGSNIEVAMKELNSTLNEVVVTGYGTQRRRSVTGAVGTVSGKTLDELPVPNFTQALQGRIAGVSVVNNGSPGSNPIVTIRGISSISFSSSPLYVIDGFPTGNLSNIDVRDIESVDVLKDASAAAIYGSAATNGVIMITTKKGKKDGKVHVGLNTFYGTQKVTERLDLLDRDQFAQYALAYRGSQVPRLLSPWLTTPIYTGASQTYGSTNTNWQDEYFRTGNNTQTTIDLSGGNNVSNFYASAGYTDQEGTTPSVGFKRYSFRINSEHNISKIFKFGENLVTSYTDQAYDANEQGTRSNLVNVIRMMPHMPVYDPTSNGGYRGVNATLDGGDPTNPIEDAELKNPGNRMTLKILGTAFLEINFTKWLKFRSSFGVDYSNGLDYRFQPIFNDNGTINGSSATQATVNNNRFLSTVLLYTDQLTFDKSFGDHHVNAIAVYEQTNQTTHSESGRGNQLSNDLRQLNNALNQSVSSTLGENSLLSFLGRVNYDFQGKYLVSAAIRRDGLSVWAPGKKWATFPSASVGWRVDQESFMKNQTLVSELKIRAGYGVTGLNGVLLGNTPWQVNVSANSAVYPFGNSLSNGLASSIQKLGNKELEWEKTKSTNVGFDLGILKNKFTLSADYFNRTTDNLILNVTIPPSFGFLNSSVPQNVAAMQNHGFELVVGYNDREGDFTWNASGNLSLIRNKVTRLAEGITNIEAGADAADFGGYGVTNTAVGQPIQSFYGWVVEGIFQNAAEVASHATQVTGANGTAPGDLKFQDMNKDGKINNSDRVFLGSFMPKITYALNLAANYKNFDLGIFFQGVQGNKIYNDTRVITEGMIRFFNAGTQVLNAWTPTNTNTDIPRAISGDPNQNSRTSTRFLEDGSYLRLKNLSLGYNVPATKLSSLTKGVVSSIRIYASATNLLTFTKYTGYDPEVGNRTPGSSLTNGIDWAIYPQPKAFQIGIQANF